MGVYITRVIVTGGVQFIRRIMTGEWKFWWTGNKTSDAECRTEMTRMMDDHKSETFVH